jgi:hypothetical protein
MQVRTRFHKVIPTIEKGDLYLTAIPGQNCAHYMQYQINPRVVVDWLGDLDHVPKFVVDPELLDIAKDGNYQQSLLDMKRADLLRLPFENVLIEIQDERKAAAFVLLQDLKQQPEQLLLDDPDMKGYDFRGWVFRLLSDEEGGYVVMAPALILMSVEEKDGMPWLRITGCAAGFLPDEARVNELVRQTFAKDAGALYHAVLSSVLIMQTSGVANEVVEPTRLNKKRQSSGKRPIPAHTYIYIGRVYRSARGDESVAYVPGRMVRPHWRRAHLHRWRTGPRKSDEPGFVSKFIPARIVALAKDAEPLSVPAPQYVVKR